MGEFRTVRVLGIKTEEIYTCLLQHSADGLVISDEAGVVTSCNPAFAKLLGRQESEIVGQPLQSIIDLEASDNRDGKEMRDGRSGSDRHPRDTTGGGTREGREASKGSAGASAGMKKSAQASAPHPATIRCRSGMDLSMPVTHIPIGPIGASNGSKSRGTLTIVYIVQTNSVQQAQTEFVSTVSHELRTPLTSIKGFADTILRAGDKLDHSQQRRYVGIIKDQADRLTRLVEDLLAVSRLESKRMQLTIRAIDLGEAIERVVRNLSDKAREHRITVSVPPGLPPVWADADRLEQILTNLIDNAIKYSPPKTTVTVQARHLGAAPEMVEFSVGDQGVGIPQEHQSEIFTKFSRLDNPLVRQTEGTGLGLYITRSLVLALGGQIKVASSPGHTTFTVQLPAASLEEQAARGRDHQPGNEYLG